MRAALPWPNIKLLALAELHPTALISGQPIYDDSIPRSRLYGRWVTHSGCGLKRSRSSSKTACALSRGLPLAPTLHLAQRVALGKRMDFDTEVMVRLYWQGNTSYFVPTRVTYPLDGLSQAFDASKTTCAFHGCTRLFWHVAAHPVAAFSPRIAALGASAGSEGFMGDAPDATGLALTGAQSILPAALPGSRRLLAHGLHRPPVLPTLDCPRARTANRTPDAAPRSLTSYQHFLRFGDAITSKIASWRGRTAVQSAVILLALKRRSNVAHHAAAAAGLASLGDVEACRALAQLQGSKTINALVFSDNAQRFKHYAEWPRRPGLNLLPVTDIGPDTAICPKLDRGEWMPS